MNNNELLKKITTIEERMNKLESKVEIKLNLAEETYIVIVLVMSMVLIYVFFAIQEINNTIDPIIQLKN